MCACSIVKNVQTHVTLLVDFPEKDEGRLWDRRADPAEQVDLFKVPLERNATQYAARQGLLLALLRWRAQQDNLAFMDDALQHGKGR